MAVKKYLGELEQMVMLAAMQLGEQAYTLGVRKELESRAGRSLSRSALYQTLDRLGYKGYLEWDFEAAKIPERGGHPMRRIRITPAGRRALRATRRALNKLWEGLEEQLEES